jgi:hypothetical protein
MKLLLILALLTLPACKGPQGTHGNHGINGVDGQDGAQGPAGANGQDGADAPATAYTPVGLLNPCGDAANIADEVLILLANGQVIASYGVNNAVRFAVLTPGNYVTTDGDNCTFTLTAAGELVNESH